MNKKENIVGFILLIVLLIAGKTMLASNVLFIRLLFGLGLGYTLSRAYTGFAGSVNRAYNTGSTKLMRTLMLLFFLTALASTGYFFLADATQFDLWVNPINLGLILGGILFGFGMAFSSCCASGVLTDLITALPRAGVTLIFFCMGVFLGYPVQNSQGWIIHSLFTSETGKALGTNGVFLPDWFKNDGTNGYLGALILTGIFALIVVALSYLYEKKRRQANTYHGVLSEKMQDNKETVDVENFTVKSEKTYYHLFVSPWTLKQGAVILTIIFTVMMGVTKAGWGASTPYGMWFGKFLMLFGVSADSLASFTKMAPEFYANPLLENGVSVQNFGILFGTLIFLLTSGQFKRTFMSEMHLTGKEAALYALGGITMGFGTRLSNGCNVGALYTPIANFSLSGWIFLIALVGGGIIGNKFAKKWTA
ncbi:YeeE/YedE family protein [Vagococcus humatus]|uniref:Uncharacterized protein n=1 Tax=Vagococcus humatus TaxID=1889241 RepID=A0A3R9YLF5_9ENTE|nr:YeeE/YedE family protein [Vagococcus humatus]RST90408.1 hypothetical protein C7P63_04850 [Vagococcus humatus]